MACWELYSTSSFERPGPGINEGPPAPVAPPAPPAALDDGRDADEPHKVDSLHPVSRVPGVVPAVRLLLAEELAGLPQPWPRCQDLPEACFGVPDADGLVVAVSHAWRNQAHPDPSGRKAATVKKVLQTLRQETEVPLYLFFDFLSIPQRPFQPGQPARSAAESASFGAALGCMHNLYFLADRIVHLEFENEELEGEGQVYFADACELFGAEFLQVGDHVQVASAPSGFQLDMGWMASSVCCYAATSEGPEAERARSCEHRASGGEAARASSWLFHRVLAVGDDEVTRVEQLQDLGAPGDLRRVKLMRFDFGRVNDIPADERGWIFLERFITAVKCAMLTPAEASRALVTSSPSIRADIEGLAARLREASRLAGCDGPSSGSSKEARLLAGRGAGSSLDAVLDECLARLAKKRFSGTSTDKLQLGAERDREVVETIMRGFVDHLRSNWQAEAARQRRRAAAAALAEAALAYVLEWQAFSPGQLARIDEASRRWPWPLLLLCFPLPFLSFTFLLMPSASPDASWRDQGVALVLLTVDCIIVVYYFPSMLLGFSGLDCSLALELKILAWACWNGLATTATTVALASSLDIWPVPFTAFIGLAVLVLNLGLLWKLLPLKLRQDALVRQRLRASFGILSSICLILGTLFPILNMFLKSTDRLALQAAIVVSFLLAKLLFEAISHKVGVVLGADAMPGVTVAATMAYEANLCIALGSGFEVVVFIELLLFDFFENMYHLWSLGRNRKKYPAAEGKDLFIVSTLVLREFVELLASTTFLITIVVVRHVRPELSDLLCRLSDAEFRRMCGLVAVDVLVEVLVAGLTYAALRRSGYAPLRLLRGLAYEYRRVFLVCPAALWIYYWCLQYPHTGMDLSLRLPWIANPDLRWQCGMHWA